MTVRICSWNSRRTGKARIIRLYGVWRSMIDRCSRPAHKNFNHYGGKGITVCQEWLCFLAFRQWAISAGYRKGLTLDRVDGSQGYTPENCRFASWQEQAENTTKTRWIEFNGRRNSLRGWAREIGISPSGLRGRLERWSLERALTEKPNG